MCLIVFVPHVLQQQLFILENQNLWQKGKKRSAQDGSKRKLLALNKNKPVTPKIVVNDKLQTPVLCSEP
jgi:hypothetical protein